MFVCFKLSALRLVTWCFCILTMVHLCLIINPKNARVLRLHLLSRRVLQQLTWFRRTQLKACGNCTRHARCSCILLEFCWWSPYLAQPLVETNCSSHAKFCQCRLASLNEQSLLAIDEFESLTDASESDRHVQFKLFSVLHFVNMIHHKLNYIQQLIKSA